MDISDNTRISVLIEALPHFHNVTGKRILIKVGGELFESQEATRTLVTDIASLRALGVQVVLVHGGGPQITRMMERFGKEPCFIEGQRVTDQESLKLTAMVMIGDINTSIVAALNSYGTPAVGLNGTDGSMIEVVPRDAALGFVGTVKHVNTRPIISALESNYVPVIAGLGVDESGQIYNINADTTAGKLATALEVKKWFLLTNVKGIYSEFGKEESFISVTDVVGLIKLRAQGSLSTGMIPKVEAILGAVKGGVDSVHLIDGRIPHAILLELCSDNGIGTMISKV
jgi:acetylglutamate kinase